MFHYTVDTEEAIASLEQNLKDENFGIPWQFGIQDKLNEEGIEFNQKYQILEVCQDVEKRLIACIDKSK